MEPSVPQFVFSTQVMLPTKVPLKITAGRPSVPLPIIWKVLPTLLNVPPVVRLPDVNAPVVKPTLPHGAKVAQVPAPRPITEVRFEPVRVSPALLPAKVPPVFPKSTLPAKAATGKARASKAIRTIRFMFPPELRSKTQSKRPRRLRASSGGAELCPALAVRAPWLPNQEKR